MELQAIPFLMWLAFSLPLHLVESKCTINSKLKNELEIAFIGELRRMPVVEERCGDDAIAAVYRFEIAKNLSKKRDLRMVDIVVACPETLGEGFFQPGMKYRVEATGFSKEMERYRIVKLQQSDLKSAFWMLKIEKYECSH